MKALNLSVFLVDDDKMFLKSLEHHLQHILKHYIKIKTFATGEDVVKNLDQKPDIIILDYLLNGQYPHAMDGIEVLDKIKKAEPEAVVIVLSGQDKMEVAVNAMKHGAYDYVVKNENTFLRIQNIVKNAMNAISLSRELKTYKFWKKVILSLIALIIIGTIVMQLFFPNVMR